MNIDELQTYIDEFLGWIDQDGVSVLKPDQLKLATYWREELKASQRMLEIKPELPIAFLGPSQQGKSSLINAILGENILAVGGAIGACTSVITSVHYSENERFLAEINFISLDDWRAELTAMNAALSNQPSDEDTPLDLEELESGKQVALEKFRAVYRRDPDENLFSVMGDPKLGLPEEIAKCMLAGKAVTVEEGSALTLRNSVRRYLVGRASHQDGQYWPLITRVRIFGRFEVLKNGVVLVDLPGLNDPNPAREQVTKKYLQDARYIWLICNSQTGIDRVFTQVLRENGLLFRLFLEGRLDAFSVVTTRVDDVNVEEVLSEMGLDSESFDGNYEIPMNYRREAISKHIHKHLVAIAEDIVVKAESSEARESFLRRVRAIPVFSVSTAAYLHQIGRMPLYGGLKLSLDESQVPQLVEHLHTITRLQSYKVQVEAASRRLQVLYEQVKSFFLNEMRQIDEGSEEAIREWDGLGIAAAKAINERKSKLEHLFPLFDQSLQNRCSDFEARLAECELRAQNGLRATFVSWEAIHWRSLQAAVRYRGEWYSRALDREFNFNRDIARVYVDLLPFLWEEFFGSYLSALVEDLAKCTQSEVQKVADWISGAMSMLKHQQPAFLRSVELNVETGKDSFSVQVTQVRAELTSFIQRTRQSLSNGMIEAASTFMQPAYSKATQAQGGTGVKKRILEVLIRHAEKEAPGLFLTMRQDLTEGVGVLKGLMKPQLLKIVGYGTGVLDRFQQNLSNNLRVEPERRTALCQAVTSLPRPFRVSDEGSEGYGGVLSK